MICHFERGTRRNLLRQAMRISMAQKILRYAQNDNLLLLSKCNWFI